MRREIRRDLPAKVIAFHILSLYNGAVLAVVSGIERAEDTLQSAWPFILEGVRRGNHAGSMRSAVPMRRPTEARAPTWGS